MGQLVLAEARNPPKSLPTGITLEWLLCGVDPLMGYKAEAFWCSENMCLLPCMHALVLSKRGALAEGLPTLLAGVGPLPSVCSLMPDKL